MREIIIFTRRPVVLVIEADGGPNGLGISTDPGCITPDGGPKI